MDITTSIKIINEELETLNKIVKDAPKEFSDLVVGECDSIEHSLQVLIKFFVQLRAKYRRIYDGKE